MTRSKSKWELMNFVEQCMKSEIPPSETPTAITADVVSLMELSLSKPDEFNELLHLPSNPFPMAAVDSDEYHADLCSIGLFWFLFLDSEIDQFCFVFIFNHEAAC
ncbi:hypothetical protein ACB092_11G162500 [Castanea dentata]